MLILSGAGRMVSRCDLPGLIGRERVEEEINLPIANLPVSLGVRQGN
jgi:hypothetical protein